MIYYLKKEQVHVRKMANELEISSPTMLSSSNLAPGSTKSDISFCLCTRKDYDIMNAKNVLKENQR